MAAATLHVRPTTDLADRALLPGDPGRALALAQSLLTDPVMFNHHRGLWGYTGTAADGRALTIQSTGMGGPSAAIVLEELIRLGLRRAVRVGTCGALDAGLGLGDLVVACEAIAADGTSRALGAGDRVPADAALTERLTAAATALSRGSRAGAVVSTDLFYDPDPDRHRRWGDDGAVAVEMEAATLFALGGRREIAVGAILTVSDRFTAGGRERIEDEALLEAAEAMGRVAVAALAEAAG